MVSLCKRFTLQSGLFECKVQNLCRHLATSEVLLKKGKKKSGKTSETTKLKREAPFIFKVAKHAQELEKKHEPSKVKIEKPFLFHPISIDTTDIEDDHTTLFHEFKRHSLHKEHVVIIQPNFKWGKERFTTKLVDHRLLEAKALIESMQSWTIHSTRVESVHEIHPKLFFGSGKVLELSEKIRVLINEHKITMIFLNAEQLSVTQIRELEAALGCKVFDRYRVVLELFKERAHTKDAKLQVELAELKYLRAHLTSEESDFDQQRGGGRGFFGTGETKLDKSKQLLANAESKIKKQLHSIKMQREQAKAERIKKKVPHVALVGYTNAGKTTLAKLLSQDQHMTPEDKLFATLDTTAHRGKLPSGLNLVYIDTVGFISDLPHELVESFSTTLEDVKTADLLVHVSDISHPEYELQKTTVEGVLSKLNLPASLLDSRIHVLNKIDLRNDIAEEMTRDNVFLISCQNETGILGLKHHIEERILQTTGRGRIIINIDQTGGELSWLYHYGTVVETIAQNDGSLDVVALLDHGNQARFEREFGVKLKHQ